MVSFFIPKKENTMENIEKDTPYMPRKEFSKTLKEETKKAL